MNDTPERSGFDWETRFRDGHTPWERGGLHPALARWAATGAVRAGRSIIVPGCGRALEPLELARLGLNVTAADLSATALAWQRAQFNAAGLDAELVEGDVLAWRPDEPADLVWEQTFLCAIPPALRADYERAVHAWLKPGGALLALFMQKAERGGPPYGCALDAMRALFPAERWAWPEEQDFIDFPHPGLDDKSELGGVLVRR